MRVAHISLGLFGAIGMMAAVAAGAAIWLLVTDPVTVADAVASGDMSPLMREVALVLKDALYQLVRYL